MIRRFAKQICIFSALLLVGLGLTFIASHSVLAQDNSGSQALGLNNAVQQTIGLGGDDIRVTVAKIIRVALGLLGIVAVVLMVYAGYEWMTAGGNDEQIEGAKKIMKNAVIGLVIILSAYSIVSFVISKLLEATTGLPAHCFDHEQNYDETGIDTGGSCGANYGQNIFNNSLYVVSLPSAGNACAANYHPIITFSRPVDLQSFVTSSIYVEKVNGGEKVVGSWVYLDPNNKNMVAFIPSGACGNMGGNDCFEPDTDFNFVVVFDDVTKISAIHSLNSIPQNVLPLRCDLKAGCGPVAFKTGSAVDRKPPAVSISYPKFNTLLAQGGVIPVRLSFSDDVGVSTLQLWTAVGLPFTPNNSLVAPRIVATIAPAYSLTSEAVADFDSDGNVDIITAGTATSALRFYRGLGDGILAPATKFSLGNNSTVVSTADFNGDSIADLLILPAGVAQIVVAFGKGDGTFLPAKAYAMLNAGLTVKTGDFTGDGKPDVIVYLNTNPRTNTVFVNNGTGGFTNKGSFPMNGSSVMPAIADYNSDGKADLAVPDYAGSLMQFYIGNGDGTFTFVTTSKVVLANGFPGKPYGAELVDVNGDGKPDLLTLHLLVGAGDSVSVRFGLGNGQFSTTSAYFAVGGYPAFINTGDVNGDGKADVVTLSYVSGNHALISILINKGDGTFLTAKIYTISNNGSQTLGTDSALGDFNNDGLLDVSTLYNDSTRLESGIALLTADRIKNAPVFSLVDSVALNNCQTSGTVQLAWPTDKLSTGFYTLQGKAYDYPAQEASSTRVVKLLPATCFNNVQDPGEDEVGPIACGQKSACGICGGKDCATNSDCASNSCLILQGQDQGVCVNKPQITDFSPRSAGKDSFLSIKGYFFGSKQGSVSFAFKNNPDPNVNADWKDAPIISCGGYSGWTDRQIIVQVPDGIVSGPIRLITVASSQAPSFIDTTALDGLPNFNFTNEQFPGICSISPPRGNPGKPVVITGKGFGLQPNLANDFVFFGKLKSVIGLNAWADLQINTTVPNLEQGYVGVVVTVNGKQSNSFEFEVLSGSETGAPLITNVTPTSGPHGQYITIEGSGFGSLVGEVWFKDPVSGEVLDPAQVFDFPKDICDATDFWRDDRIIAKFPKTVGAVGTSYFIQVQPQDRTVNASLPDPKFKYLLTNGVASPGLCSLNPASGAVPFVAPQMAILKGEYFTADTDVYFAKNGQTKNPVTGSLATPSSWTNNKLEVLPIDTTITGNVVAYRRSDKSVSNPIPFAAVDCTTQGNVCGDASQRCCIAGPQKGFCKLKNDLCAGETRSTGYIWRFSTKDIPEIPHVVERCDDTGQNLKVTIPSPSPNVRSYAIWGGVPHVATSTDPHYNVCRTAISFVEFTTQIDQNTVKDAANMSVYRCTNFNEDTTCATWTQVNNLDPLSYRLLPASETRSYLAIQPTANLKGVKQWDNNILYQVVLKKTIKSLAAPGNSANLGEDAPCDGNGITNSAYCFQFRTDDQDCTLRAVLVTPYVYFTTYLEDPMLYHDPTGVVGDPVPYTGNGLSTQRCVMMDVSNYNWAWDTEKPAAVTYADIHDGANQQTSHVSALTNTKGVTPGDSVDITATATLAPKPPVTGVSPLTIDLSDPQVVEAWPTCLEACTNAAVGVRFNMTMNNKNLPGSPSNGTVQLLECKDENCLSTVSVLTVDNINGVALDQGSHYTILNIANASQGQAQVPALNPDTKYKVILSVEGDPADDTLSNQMWASYKYNDPSSAVGKKYNKQYTWSFKTKKEACTIDRVAVTPKDFFAKNINDRSLFSALPYSAPDACSATGQKLNPWSVNWQWFPTDAKVATVQTFSTKIASPNCTVKCVRKGSDVPYGNTSPLAICGNGVIEAGEDCETPEATKQCGLDCKYVGNPDPVTCGNGKLDRDAFFAKNGYGEQCDPKDPATQVNCSADCRHLGSDQVPNPNNPNLSICGNGKINGKVGSGEDCDIGVPADVNDPLSSLGCSNICLHQGTNLSKHWCQVVLNNGSLGGFAQKDYDAACKKAYSTCGDGIADGDEDPFCESLGAGKLPPECSSLCLLKQGNTLADVANGNSCGNNPNSILPGCDEDFVHVGSSVLYPTPSVCGDNVVGTGEDASCEAVLSGKALQFNPWSLAKGVGTGTVDKLKTPPQQSTPINATTNEKTKNNATVKGSGNFTIQCGYKTDADCAVVGEGLGVGADSCCYARPELVSTFPVTSTPIQHDVCPNTYLAATFNQKMDSNSLPGNVLIAIASDDPCPAGSVDVFDQIVKADPGSTPKLVWYKIAYQKITNFIKSIFGGSVQAKIIPNPVHWCVGQDVGTPTITEVPGLPTYSRMTVQLDHPLSTESYYAVLLTSGVKNSLGVKLTFLPINWKFTTASKLCEVNNVTVLPPSHLFSTAGSTSTFTALGAYAAPNGSINFLQSIPGFYAWNYIWGPVSNNFVTFSTTTSNSTTTLTALNQNGELDVRAAANITQNTISAARGIVATGNSHVTVFLCENPWPPKSQRVGNNGPFTIFPYEDKANNNDDYDPILKQFNNKSIPSTEFLSDGYFNFRTYYCADASGLGTVDDLPYVRAAVQTSTKALAVLPNTCGLTGVGLNGNTCVADADCGLKYTTTTQVFAGTQTALCASVSTNNVPTYYVKNNMAFSCAIPGDCSNNNDFTAWVKDSGGTAGCVAAPTNAVQNKCYAHRPLKRFFFTSDKSGDTIGLQVFENRDFLTAEQWFEGDEAAGGQGFAGNITKTKIDGYNAVTDGNNYYVEGLNYASYTNPQTKQVAHNLYGTIYLLGINADAKPETRQVFDAVRKNLSLNINLSNYGYCGKSIDNPGFSTQCSTDFDCPTGQVCSNQKTKLQRDYVRLRDTQTIENSLRDYYEQTGGYPDLTSGSLLTYQTISTWPQSWTLLSNQISAVPPLPADPINQLGDAGTCASNTTKFCTVDGQCPQKPGTQIPDTCTLHDSATGWSTANRRFSFACSTSSLAYRYIYSTSTKKYELRMKIEDIGIKFDNEKTLAAIFNPFQTLKVSDLTGMCVSDAEISSIESGYCGDSVINVNKGEACDPPKSSHFGTCGADGVDGQIKVDVCTNNCKWTASSTYHIDPITKLRSQAGYVFCSYSSVCGNGVKEIGEVCDQGPLNGTFNSCDKTCNGFTNLCGNNKLDPGELCEITDTVVGSVKKGWCLGGLNAGLPCNPGLNSADCNLKGNLKSYSGLCSDTKIEGVKYATTASDQNTSCGFSCRSRGPYCGDGVVQTEFGEECDGSDNSCPIGNIKGVRTCTSQCKYTDTEAPVWFALNDAVVSPQNDATYSNSGALPAIIAKCNAINCPTFGKSSGHNGTGAATFNPARMQYLTVDDNAAIMATTSFSIEMWLNVANYPVDSARILEKGGWNLGPGYDLEMFNGNLRFILWRNGGVDGGDIFSNDTVPLNSWTHVVITYDKQMVGQQKIQTMRIYVNGKQSNEKVTTNDPDWFTENKNPLYIGRASDIAQSLYFSGTIDDFRYYPRALQPTEIVDHAGNPWVCRANLAPLLAEAPAAVCGDGKVGVNESCDKANANGIVCVPGYNQSCTYCSKDCLVTTVEPKEYCGNGKIEANELCDTNPQLGITYASKSNITSTFPDLVTENNVKGYQVKDCKDELLDRDTAKTGTKTCNKCQTIVNKEVGSLGCLICGLTPPSGEKINGGIINTIMPQLNGAAPGPLYAYGQISLVLNGNNGSSVIAARKVNNLDTYILAPGLSNSAEEAIISSAPICSISPGKPSYQLGVATYSNNQVQDYVETFYFNFPVLADPKNLSPWRYDLILSPIIPKTAIIQPAPIVGDFVDNQALPANGSLNARPNDIRLVVSWRGEGSLVGGFLLAKVNGAVATLEQSQFNVVPSNENAMFYYNNKQSLSAFVPAIDNRANITTGLWYHGRGDTDNQTHTLAFTIDTLESNQSGSMLNSQYGFFIRSADNLPLSSYRLRNVQVQVYYPENGTNGHKFGTAVKTIHLEDADLSDNASATYWHVANIKSGATVNAVAGEAEITKRVVAPVDPITNLTTPSGRIVSSPSQIFPSP